MIWCVELVDSYADDEIPDDKKRKMSYEINLSVANQFHRCSNYCIVV